MKFRRTAQVLMAAAVFGLAAVQAEPDAEAEARDLVQRFAGQLKPALKGALQSGGPAAAIEMCSSMAPAIAASLSAESGWTVRRVSLKARNPGAIPDDWERSVLQQFEQQRAAGEPGSTLNRSQTVDGEYRYMQAQLAEPLCLQCHGTHITGEVSEALQKHYPADQATGYTEGQVRGAISLRRPAGA